MRRSGFVMVVTLAGTLAAGCGGDGGGRGGDKKDGTATDTVTMIDNEFKPSDPVVSAGSTLALPNDGEALHTFTVDDQGIDEQVQPGEDATVAISLEAGEYTFDCSFHPEMTGTLTVQ